MHACNNLTATRLPNGDSRNRPPARRQFVDDRDIKIGVRRHCQRSRDRGSGHDKLMRLSGLPGTFFTQRHSLMHTKAVLFINDDKAKVLKLDTVLKQCMRANNQLCLATGDCLKRAASGHGTLATREPRRFNPERPEPV